MFIPDSRVYFFGLKYCKYGILISECNAEASHNNAGLGISTGDME
jgi:hypothetical protein